MQTPIKWMHQVKPEWLEARREHQILTASEVKKLVPAWKKVMGFSYRKKELTLEDVKNAEPVADFYENPALYEPFIKEYADKLADIPLDPRSYDAAARGHFYEPYAIKNFNRDNNLDFHHWDDTLVRNLDKGIGCSLDACTIEQPKDCPVVIESSTPTGNKYSILEIKCYNAGHHMMCLLTDQYKLEERWQIAAAFVADEDIETGTIYYWNPSVKTFGYWVCFNRDCLALEMAIIESILDVYKTVKVNICNDNMKIKGKPMFTIDDITKDYLEEISKPENVLERMVV